MIEVSLVAGIQSHQMQMMDNTDFQPGAGGPPSFYFFHSTFGADAPGSPWKFGEQGTYRGLSLTAFPGTDQLLANMPCCWGKISSEDCCSQPYRLKASALALVEMSRGPEDNAVFLESWLTIFVDVLEVPLYLEEVKDFLSRAIRFK